MGVCKWVGVGELKTSVLTGSCIYKSWRFEGPVLLVEYRSYRVLLACSANRWGILQANEMRTLRFRKVIELVVSVWICIVHLCYHIEKRKKRQSLMQDPLGRSSSTRRRSTPQEVLLHSDRGDEADFISSSYIISSSLSSTGMVLWLYSPWAIKCNANGLRPELVFLILARLFWNHILIWDSFNLSSRAKSWRRFSVKYLLGERTKEECK